MPVCFAISPVFFNCSTVSDKSPGNRTWFYKFEDFFDEWKYDLDYFKTLK